MAGDMTDWRHIPKPVRQLWCNATSDEKRLELLRSAFTQLDKWRSRFHRASSRLSFFRLQFEKKRRHAKAAHDRAMQERAEKDAALAALADLKIKAAWLAECMFYRDMAERREPSPLTTPGRRRTRDLRPERVGGGVCTSAIAWSSCGGCRMGAWTR